MIRVSERYSHALSRLLKLFKADSLIIFFSFTYQILMLECNLVKIIKV